MPYFDFGEGQAKPYKDGEADWWGSFGAGDDPPSASNPHICNTLRRIRASCNFSDFRSGLTICVQFSHENKP